jgi:hypothetical protein
MNTRVLLQKPINNLLARVTITTAGTAVETVTNHYLGPPGDATRIAVRHCIDFVHNTPNHTTGHGCD